MGYSLTISDMQVAARDRGGKCLSKEYRNNHTPLSWMCSKGHTWDSVYSIVRQGGWCPRCAKKATAEERLEMLNDIAKKHGGSCLSEKYLHFDKKLKWKCKNRHTWLMTPHSIMSGSWCVQCFRDQQRTIALEKIISIARKKGGAYVSGKYEGKSSRLKWKCKQGHSWIMTPQFINQGYWCKYCNKEKRNIEELKGLKLFAKNKGGQCLSEKFTAHTKVHLWKCAEGHEWKAKPVHLRAYEDKWCPKCTHEKRRADSRKYTIEDLRRHAKKRGGKMLSSSYINIVTPVKWECAEGHQWMGQPISVIDRNSWCRKCSGQRIPISVFHAIAKEHGGKLLSKKYINSKTHLEWECKRGHRWIAQPHSIKAGKWCKECLKLPIEKFQKIAEERGGKLISKKYINTYTRLQWMCAEEHKWTTTPAVILRGSWCPSCADSRNTRYKKKLP